MSKENAKPQIRFKGFSEDWERRKLVDEVSSVDTGKSKFSSRGSGIYEILGSTSIIGYDDSYDYEGDFLLTARVGANAGELYRYSGKVKISDNTVFIQGKQLDFIYYALINFDIKKLSFGTGQPLVKASELKEQKILMAVSDSERSQIGAFFCYFDYFITFYQRRYNKLHNIKKSMLAKMFPKNGSNVPEIRFKGFTKDWEQHKLEEYCEMYNGDRSSKYPNAQDMVSDGIAFINAGDLEDGCVNFTTANKITREKYDDLGGAKLQFGDIVYCLRGTLGKNAYIDNFTEGTIASSLVVIRPKNIDGRYLFHVLNSDIEYRQRIVHDEGAAQPNLSAKNVSCFIIPIPDIDEQKKISSCLDNLNNLLTLQQRKLEKLKNIKKSMLEKMFV